MFGSFRRPRVQSSSGTWGIDGENKLRQNASRRASDPPAPALRESSFTPPRFRPKNDDNIILVMGASGSGKSTFIKTITGQEEATAGHGLRSFTQEVRPFRCLAPSLSDLVLVDTPGFADTVRSDADVLEHIVTWLSDLMESGGAITGIILLHRISDVRMSGHSVRNLTMFEKLCGEDAFSNVVLVSTMWDAVAEDIAITRESELKEDFWNTMIQKGARVSRFDRRNTSSAHDLLDLVCQKEKTILAIQREVVLERKPIYDTAAGAVVVDALTKAAADHKRTLATLEAEARSSHVQQNAALRQTIAEERFHYQRLLEEGIAAQKRLRAGTGIRSKPATGLTEHSAGCWASFFRRRFHKRPQAL